MAGPILLASDTWFTSGATSAGVTKASITSVSIVDTYTPQAEYKSWNCAVTDTGTATVFVEGTKLTIAGDGSGKVRANSDSSNLFKGFTGLTSFDSGVFDTSGLVSLYRGFYDCSSLEHLDLTSWNVERLTNLQAAFNGMYALKTLLVHNWNTISLTNMRATFQCSPSIEELDLSGWVVDNVTTMYGAFSGHQTYGGFSHLKKIIGYENWNVEKVTDMGGMFAVNDSMTSIDLSKWKNTACTNTSQMMTGMLKLEKVTLGADFKFAGNAPHIAAPRPEYIEGATDGNWYTVGGKAYTNMALPSGVDCTYYASRNMIENISVVINNKVLLDTAGAIKAVTGTNAAIKPINFNDAICYPTLSSSFLSTISKEMSVETLRFVSSYDGNYSVTWPADDMKTGSITGYLNDKTVIISSNGSTTIRVSANASNLFAGLSLLKTIVGIEMLDVSCVKYFDGAFSKCSALKSVDLSGLNFSSNLVSYDRLFADCYRLESATLWNGIKYVAPSMFFACLNLQNIVGLSNVTEVGSKAFIHATNLVSVDIDPLKVTSIGDMACRRSNIEDVVDFTQSTLTHIGIHSIRSNRWNASELNDIKGFFSSKAYSDVYIDVPSTENQYNYPHTVLGYDGDNGPVSIATWGCSSVATYHEWNAVYNKLGNKEKVYTNFQSWWDTEVIANDPDYADTNDVNTDSLAEVRDILGWTSATREFVNSVSQLEVIANRLSQGLPVYASVYSTNTLGGMHAVLIIGMRPSEGKIAVLDSAVTGHTGVVSWLRFEDLFVRRSYLNDGSEDDRYFGRDSLRLVTDYNVV